MSWKVARARLIYELANRTRYRWFLFHRYDYMFTPRQLGSILDAIDETKTLGGSVLEIGCAFGATTVYMKKAMNEANDHRSYTCIDTFSGFVESDIDHEIRSRNKSAGDFGGFRVNKKSWFDRTLATNNVDGVNTIQGDINAIDLGTVTKQISFCLIDVDLYRPVMSALNKVWERLVEGGIILIDDCTKSEDRYDGALEAYTEFVTGKGLEKKILHEKLGVIRKPFANAARH